MTTAKLKDLAKVIRSKNAGALLVTLDVMFDDGATYQRVQASGALAPRRLARRARHHRPDQQCRGGGERDASPRGATTHTVGEDPNFPGRAKKGEGEGKKEGETADRSSINSVTGSMQTVKKGKNAKISFVLTSCILSIF